MDVGRAAFDSVDQDRIDQPHHRLRVLVTAGLQAVVINLAGFDLGQDAVDREFVAVELVDVVAELGFRSELGFQFHLWTEHRTQLVQRHDVENLGGGDGQYMVGRIIGDRQQMVAAREFFGYQAQCFRVGQDLRKINRFLADGPRHDVADSRFGDESETYQQSADGDVAVALFGKDDGQLILGDQPLLDQQLAEPQFLSLFGHRSCPAGYSGSAASWRMRSCAWFRLKPDRPRACARSTARR